MISTLHQTGLSALAEDTHKNKFLEGWHNRFACVMDVAHPDIYNFIKSLKSVLVIIHKKQQRCGQVSASVGELSDFLSVRRKDSTHNALQV